MMLSSKQLGAVVIVLGLLTVGIPASGVSLFGTDQATNAVNSQSDVQNNTTAQVESNTTQPSTTRTTTETPSQQATQETTQTQTSAGSNDRSLLDVFHEARTSYRNINDVNATIESKTTISTATDSQSYNASANVSYKAPNKFRLELLEPKAQAGTVVASNGTAGVFYDPTTDTTTTFPMSDVTSDVSPASVMGGTSTSGMSQATAGTAAMGVNRMGLSGLNDPSRLLSETNVTYNGTATFNGYQTDVISVESKNESLGYTASATIYLDQKTNLPVGGTSDITLTSDGPPTTIHTWFVVSNLAVNEGIPDSVFDSVPKSGGQVGGGASPSASPYYQVDFVTGDPIENLRSNEGYYTPDRLIRFAHGNSEQGITRVSDGEFITDASMADRIDSHDITVENGTATVTFTVSKGDPVTLTLASYEKTGPGWSPQTEAKQDFIDAQTKTFESGTHTLTVDLPTANPEEPTMMTTAMPTPTPTTATPTTETATSSQTATDTSTTTATATPSTSSVNDGPGDDLNCGDFPSKQAAQRNLDNNPSDPNQLDHDNDGEACDAGVSS